MSVEHAGDDDRAASLYACDRKAPSNGSSLVSVKAHSNTGRGRGAHMTKPAWMSRQEQSADGPTGLSKRYVSYLSTSPTMAPDGSAIQTYPVIGCKGNERQRPFATVNCDVRDSGIRTDSLAKRLDRLTKKAQEKLKNDGALKNQRLVDRVAIWSGGDAEAVKRANEATNLIPRKDWRFPCLARCTEKFPTKEIRDLHVMGTKNRRHKRYRDEQGQKLQSAAESADRPTPPSTETQVNPSEDRRPDEVSVPVQYKQFIKQQNAILPESAGEKDNSALFHTNNSVVSVNAASATGRGRGAHMTKPAWMSRQEQNFMKDGPTGLPKKQVSSLSTNSAAAPSGSKSDHTYPAIEWKANERECPLETAKSDGHHSGRWQAPTKRSDQHRLRSRTAKIRPSGETFARVDRYRVQSTVFGGIIETAIKHECPRCGTLFKQKSKCFKHIKDCLRHEFYRCLGCDCVQKKLQWSEHTRKCHGIAIRQAEQMRVAADTQDGKILERIMRHSSRSDDLLSEEGSEAIVKKILLPGSKPHKSRCLMAVDPHELFQLHCTKRGCKMKANMFRAKAEYSWCRRRTRRTLGLLSLSAPIDSKSFHSINDVAKSCGITSNTRFLHLTILEGLRIQRPSMPVARDPHWFEYVSKTMQKLRAVLFGNPSVTINSLHTVPRLSDERTVLVVADVSLTSAANDAVGNMSRQFDLALPQFPLHIAIGACPSTNADAAIDQASSRLKGLSLKIDAAYLSVLPPSLDERFNHQSSSSSCARSKAGHTTTRLETHKEAFEAAISTATKVAEELNSALLESSDSMFTWTNSGYLAKQLTNTYNQITQHDKDALPEEESDLQDNLESLREEIKHHQVKIASLCSRIDIIDKDLETRGLVN